MYNIGSVTQEERERGVREGVVAGKGVVDREPGDV